MTDKTKNNLRKGVGLFLSVWTVLVGVAFIVQVWRIYGLGDNPFTVDSIGAYFRQIAVPVYIWLAAVVIGGVLLLAFPVPQKKVTPYIDLKCTLARLNKRLPESGEEAKKLQKKRLVAQWICVVAAMACAVIALVYMVADYQLSATSGFFAEHTEAERLLRALIWFIAAAALAIATAYFVQGTYKKEIAFAKSEIAANAKNGVKVTAQAERVTLKDVLLKKFAFMQSKWFTLGLRIVIGVLGVVFIITGIFNGGMKAVLYKAITICSQCIGIG